MGKGRKQKNPPPDNSIYEEREPEQEPTAYPGSGQHQPDIQDERSKKKRSNIPQQKDDLNPEEVPGNGNPEEYNDGEPVEEKSPKARL
jgi:hypothetical protein